MVCDCDWVLPSRRFFPRPAIRRHSDYVQDLTQIRALEETSRRQDRLAAIGRMAVVDSARNSKSLGGMRGSIQMFAQNGRGLFTTELMEIILRESDRLNRNQRFFELCPAAFNNSNKGQRG